jgi:hypothetical protein
MCPDVCALKQQRSLLFKVSISNGCLQFAACLRAACKAWCPRVFVTLASVLYGKQGGCGAGRKLRANTCLTKVFACAPGVWRQLDHGLVRGGRAGRGLGVRLPAVRRRGRLHSCGGRRGADLHDLRVRLHGERRGAGSGAA